MEPMAILRVCKVLFPNLFQTTAFGLTGLVTIDMLSKLAAENSGSQSVDLIFLDTLYHFQETYDLVDRVRAKYPNVKLHVFKPVDVDSVTEFEDTYGEKLYEMSAELAALGPPTTREHGGYLQLRVGALLRLNLGDPIVQLC